MCIKMSATHLVFLPYERIRCMCRLIKTLCGFQYNLWKRVPRTYIDKLNIYTHHQAKHRLWILLVLHTMYIYSYCKMSKLIILCRILGEWRFEQKPSNAKINSHNYLSYKLQASYSQTDLFIIILSLWGQLCVFHQNKRHNLCFVFFFYLNCKECNEF